jgi:Holliday junction resolvase RusA-like endonuclease
VRQIVFSARLRGVPRPQGSLVPYGYSKTGRPQYAHPATLIEWRENIVTAMKERLPEGWTPLTGPLGIRLDFYLPRPERHYFRDGRLRPDAPSYVSEGADLDKLTRALFDATTIAGVVDDDRRYALIERATKTYAPPSDMGAYVEIWRLA